MKKICPNLQKLARNTDGIPKATLFIFRGVQNV
jgi:hypothetical protein